MDHGWEALIEVTHANPALERGKLNRALKVIREACAADGLDVPAEIRRRARAYQKAMPDVMLTPMALAKHWYRVSPNGAAPSPPCPECGVGSGRHAADCPTLERTL